MAVYSNPIDLSYILLFESVKISVMYSPSTVFQCVTILVHWKHRRYSLDVHVSREIYVWVNYSDFMLVISGVMIGNPDTAYRTNAFRTGIYYNTVFIPIKLWIVHHSLLLKTKIEISKMFIWINLNIKTFVIRCNILCRHPKWAC
jgi:hypothetical protein